MLSLVELKKYYTKMYAEIRNYIWNFETVQRLAELEIEVFKRFPNISVIRSKFLALYSYLRQTCSEDEYLSEAVENFRYIIYSSDECYSRIVKPQEV